MPPIGSAPHLRLTATPATAPEVITLNPAIVHTQAVIACMQGPTGLDFATDQTTELLNASHATCPCQARLNLSWRNPLLTKRLPWRAVVRAANRSALARLLATYPHAPKSSASCTTSALFS